MKINIPNHIKHVMNLVKSYDYEIYLVGGCLRDTLLGKEPKDYDLATNCDINKLKEIFSNFNLINNNGEKHNTITIYNEKSNIEITTFKHDENEANTIEADLGHRDITINALAYANDELIDFCNSQEDLKNKLIRAVNNPYDRFKEDPLRILRVLRFSSILDFDIDQLTSQAMFDLKDLLLNVSKERIKAELNLILIGKKVKHILKKYSSIFFVIIPELQPCLNFDQKNKYHKNTLYDHIVNVVSNTKENSIVRMAALLHDIAKPKCITIDKNNQGHFYLHPIKSMYMGESILKRLKYSNEEISKINYLVKHHDTTLSTNQKSIRKNYAKTPNLDEELFYSLIDLINADKKDHINGELIDLNKVKYFINKIKEENDCLKISDLAIDGNDLLNLGYKGKEIGDTLSLLLKIVIEEKLENKEDKIIEYLKTANL